MLGRAGTLVLLFSILLLLSVGSAQANNISDLIHAADIKTLEKTYSSNSSHKLLTADTESEQLSKSSAQGNLISYFIDDLSHEGKHEDHSYMVHKLMLKDGRIYRLYFKDAPADPSKLDEIEIEGYSYGNEIAVKSYKAKGNPKLRLQGSDATTGDALGNQTTLVAIVRDSNHSSFTYSFSQAQLQDIYFSTKSTSVTSYFQEVSDKRISFSGTVVDTLNIPNLCSGGNIFAEHGEIKALNALLAAGYDIRNYKRISLVVADDDGCIPDGIAGVGTVGNFTLRFTDDSTLRISLNVIKSRQPKDSQDVIVSAVVAHEFGHNLGLPHDNANVCGERIFSEACPSLEYGGVHSIMGISPNLAYPNAIHLQDLGWLNSAESSTLSSDDIDQEFTISAISADNSDLKTVKIPRGDGTYYTVEYRRPIRSDGQKLYPSFPTYYDGLLIYLNDEARFNDSILMDSRMQDFSRGLSLNSAGTYSNSSLAISLNENAPFSGEFYDDVNDIRITPTVLGDTSASFRVTKGGSAGGGDTSEPDLNAGWTIESLTPKIRGQFISFYLLKDKQDASYELLEKVSKVEWDYNNDGTIDYTSHYLVGSFQYNVEGDYTCAAHIYFNDGSEAKITSEISITDLVTLQISSSANSTANEALLKYNRPSKFTLRVQNKQQRTLYLDLSVLNPSLRKLIKIKPKTFIVDVGATALIPIEFAPERLIRKKSGRNADGYYEIMLQIGDKQSGYTSYIYNNILIK